MIIDITTIELFVRIALAVFLILVPVILLYKQQLPYVIELITTLKNIGITPVSASKHHLKKGLTRIGQRLPTMRRTQNLTPDASLTEEDAPVLQQFLTDTHELDVPTQTDSTSGEHEHDEMLTSRTPREEPEGLIDIDAIQDQPDTTSEVLNDIQQQDLEAIKFAALSHKERGKLDLYEKKLIEGLAIAPDSTDLLKMLADHYFESGNLVKALTILKKILNQDSSNHKAIRQIAQIYLQQKQHDTAQLLVEKAIQLKPDNPKYHITMVEIHYGNKQVKNAIKSMENVLKLRPTNKNYMLTLAGLHEEIGEPTKAKAYYKKILQIDPSNEVAKRGLKRLSFE